MFRVQASSLEFAYGTWSTREIALCGSVVGGTVRAVYRSEDKCQTKSRSSAAKTSPCRTTPPPTWLRTAPRPRPPKPPQAGLRSQTCDPWSARRCRSSRRCSS
eukprot:3589265-Prymnesium_polylepis.1